MIALGVRNIKIFFRDKSSVFFSLLGVFIIIALYALFLGDVLVKNLNGVEHARYLMDSWIIAGMLAATSVTTTLGAFSLMVEDEMRGVAKDFCVAPLKRSSIVGGYVIGAYAVGVIMTLFSFVLGEIYIVSYGGNFLSAREIFQTIGLILVATFFNTAFIYFLITFFHSMRAFSTASTVIGTLIGFLTGIYIPMGELPEGVRMIIKLFPVAHSAAIYRQIFMKTPLKLVFSEAPVESVDAIKENLGVVITIANVKVTPLITIGILVGTGFLFYGLAILRTSRKKV